MDLSDLLIFRTVVEAGGIIKAAARLHRVPSNVTTRIRQLESSVGTPLFVRDRQRLHLSPHGRLLLDYADRLLDLAEEARHAISDGAVRGTIKLGALESTTASRLPGLLSTFHERYPEVRVELRTGTNDFLATAVADRTLDAAFIAEPPTHPCLTSASMFRETLVLITSPAHRVVKGPVDVTGDSIIAFPTGCAYRRIIERWLGNHGLASVRVLELASYHAIVACVASGTGVAFVPESVLETVNGDSVKRHRLPRRVSSVTTQLAWRENEQGPIVVALRTLALASIKADLQNAAARVS